MNRPWVRTTLVLSVFAAVFMALTVTSYVQESATWDEPQFVLSGYLRLRYGDHRVSHEHPPLIPVWAALPLLFNKNISVRTDRLPSEIDDSWFLHGQNLFTHDFFYKQNDADRLLYPARFMIVLLGIGLGILVFAWVCELWGFVPAVVVLALYCVEPNILAHSRLVTTDFGLTFFMFGALYFLWRTCRRASPGNVVGAAAFFALAQTSKFSALLLGPIALILILSRAFQGEPWKITDTIQLGSVQRKLGLAVGLMLSLVAASYLAVWTVYGFRYLPAPTTPPMHALNSPQAAEHHLRIAGPLNWIDRHRLLPNLFTQGFLIGQLYAQERPAYLMGEYSDTGWWYWFPLTFLVKTPITMLLLFATGLLLGCARWKQFLRDESFIIVPIVLFMAVAMHMRLNIGLRHILPIYPFVIVLAGKAVHELLQRKRPVMVAIAVGAATLELASVYPHCLAFFNFAVGGPKHGHDYLVDSNLDWGQDLKGLKRWMNDCGVRHINLSYFGAADPAYYGIDYTPLPDSLSFVPMRITQPQLPGYVAVSATNLRGVYLGHFGRNLYAPLRTREPDAVIGYSIYIYWVERPWW